MENALADFGTTLVLGGFFIASIAAIFAILHFSNLFSIFSYPNRIGIKSYMSLGAIPVLVLCYVLGMLLEDWSHPVLSSDSLSWSFPDDKKIRAEIFYDRYGNKYAEKELITKIIDKSNDSRRVDGWIKANPGKIPVLFKFSGDEFVPHTISRLNELLTTPNFYDKLIETKLIDINKYEKSSSERIKDKKKLDHLVLEEADKETTRKNKYIRHLVDKTSKYREKKFESLIDEEIRNIKKLNRLIISETYPKVTPKNITPDKEIFENIAVKIFYDSKNYVYRDNNYFKELSKIQDRIFFSRSFCLSILITLFTLFLTFIILLPIIITRPPLNPRWSKYSIYNAIFIGLFIGLFYVGTRAFKAEEEAFANRVFGYYLSLKKEDVTQLTCCLTNNSSSQSQNQQIISSAEQPDSVRYFADNSSNKFFLQQSYLDAIKDAEVVEPGEIYRYLVPIISPSKDDLMWDKDRVLVVTWTDWDGYVDGQTIEKSREIWVTAVPELKMFCESNEIDKNNVTLRLEQLLGLPPNSGKSLFVEIWVKPDDLFRPSPDPEITDQVAGLNFPVPDIFAPFNEEYIEWFSEYINWFNEKNNKSYKYDGYPWTRLGYTYDWGGRSK